MSNLNSKANGHAAFSALPADGGLKVWVAKLASSLVAAASQQRFSFADGDPAPSLSIGDALELLALLESREAGVLSVLTEMRAESSGAHRALADLRVRLDEVQHALGGVDALAAENTKLRQRDFQFGVLGPFAIDVIDAIDGLEKDTALVTRAALRTKTTREARLCDDFARMLTLRRDELLALLARRSIEPFVTAVLSVLEPGRHKAIESKPARTAGHRGLIAGHVRPGYWRASDGWVVRPQWVNVFGGSENSSERKGDQ